MLKLQFIFVLLLVMNAFKVAKNVSLSRLGSPRYPAFFSLFVFWIIIIIIRIFGVMSLVKHLC